MTRAILPMGRLSREAVGARDECFNRQYRLRFARKCSRADRHRDVPNGLLPSSDPYLSGRRSEQQEKKNKALFAPEAVGLMVEIDHNNDKDDDDVEVGEDEYDEDENDEEDDENKTDEDEQSYQSFY